MRKTMALLVCLSLLLAIVGSVAETAPTKLTVWHTWGAGPGLDAMQEITTRFNESIGKDKGIEVTIDYVASKASGNTQSMEKLMAAIAANEAPEIALLDNFQVASWAAQSALTPLDELMKGVDLSLEGMYSWAQEGSVYQGATYSVPYNGDVRALFTNLDMFEKAGLTEADIPRTIEELNTVAEKLTVKDDKGGFEQVGFIPWASAGKPIYTWGWAFGADFYDKENNVLTVNGPEVIEALQWEHDFAAKYGLSSFVEYANGAIAGGGATDPFVSGKVAMIVKGNWDIANIAVHNPDMNYTISYIPTKSEDLITTWAGGWGFTIPRGAKHQAESIEFLKFVTSDEAQRILATLGGSISPVKATNEDVFKDNERYAKILEIIPYAEIRPSVPVGQMLWDRFNGVLDNVLYEKDTPENLLNQLNEDINDELSMF